MKTKTCAEPRLPVQMKNGIGDDLDTSPWPDVAGLKVKPTHDEIAEVAFQIFQTEGCPSDRAKAHWFEAERRLETEAAEAALH